MASTDQAQPAIDGSLLLRVRVLAALPRLAAALREVAAGAGARVVEASPGGPRPCDGDGGAEVDVVLGWYADLEEEDCRLWQAGRVPVVAALATDRLLEAGLHRLNPDGWIFLDRQLRHARSILELSRTGHCVVPAAIRSLAAVDALRRDRLGELTAQELEVLSCLGEGLPNRHIADRLAISEASTKYVVRSLLGKLRLPNRTSAGVFAASHPRS